MRVLGIDVGLTGAVALVEDGRLVWVEDMPTATPERSKKYALDVAAFANLLWSVPVDAVALEKQSAAPGQGLGSTFKLGWQAGLIEGLARGRGMDVHLIQPGVWKAALRLGSDKGISRVAARKLWPASKDFERKKDHGRAEAALLAWWYERVHSWARATDAKQIKRADGLHREFMQVQDEFVELARAREAVA